MTDAVTAACCRFLAGDAARKWALSQGLPAAPTPEQAQQVMEGKQNRPAHSAVCATPACCLCWHCPPDVLTVSGLTRLRACTYPPAVPTVALLSATSPHPLPCSGVSLLRRGLPGSSTATYWHRHRLPRLCLHPPAHSSSSSRSTKACQPWKPAAPEPKGSAPPAPPPLRAKPLRQL